MIDDLKIALKRQKKLIAIFLLTIFIPSISLSIFGIRSVINEKFRLAKQIENEHIRIADFFKTQIQSRIKDVDVSLQNLVQYPSFVEMDYKDLKELLKDRLGNNPLVEHAFIIYKNKEPLFPLYQPAILKLDIEVSKPFTASQREKLQKAEEYEFRYKNYRSAISIYDNLYIHLKDENKKAQMLNNIARCFVKLKKYQQSIKIYSRITNEYPRSITSTGLPLVLIAQLQIVDCYQALRDTENSVKNALNVYHEILLGHWDLSDDQLITYSTLVKGTITDLLYKLPINFPELEDFKKEFEQLRDIHQSKIKQWQIVTSLKKECIPELLKRLNQTDLLSLDPYHYSKIVVDKNYLVSAVMIPGKERRRSLGILGVNINNDYFEREFLNSSIGELQLGENTIITISDISGQILYGKKNQSDEFSKVTAFFEENFPPWIIELSYMKAEGAGIVNIQKSFYFWTILTLILVLVFGVVLVTRTVAHELEILKIKSDFVSSVSHEFKTPLTSIKALTERLLNDKVKNPNKMKQYFSVISQDADRLTRLVQNVLDFSKIEEGKKEYDLSKTNVAEWLNQTIRNFKKESMQRKIKIQTQIPENIPYLKIDKNAMAQAVINLLDNAVKFSPNNSEIEVIVEKQENTLIIKIKDYGMGIPQKELDKIFDKFYQGTNSIRYSVKGTGLGLTLVKHTVEAHGGKISVESKEDRGSTFSVILPKKN